ncbi:hypothetical protein COE56_00315 [Bacillus anthracis]|nr:hypothetical protein COE56_00315 [Bacillus anthracis]
MYSYVSYGKYGCFLLYNTHANDFLFYPTLTGSKTPTSKCSENKEVRGGRAAHKNPIGEG